MTVVFDSYSDPVPTVAFEICMRRAKADIEIQILAGRGEDSLGTKVIRYNEVTVDLVLEPYGRMTWHMWASVPPIIEYYLRRNGWKGARFTIFWDGLGVVGGGSLTDAIVIGGD